MISVPRGHFNFAVIISKFCDDFLNSICNFYVHFFFSRLFYELNSAFSFPLFYDCLPCNSFLHFAIIFSSVPGLLPVFRLLHSVIFLPRFHVWFLDFASMFVFEIPWLYYLDTSLFSGFWILPVFYTCKFMYCLRLFSDL